MGLESTIICVDNSEFMRNGDYLPTRLQAQQDAVNVIAHSKTRSNPESNVALMTLSDLSVLVTLTTDTGKLLAKLHQINPTGNMRFISGIKIAHLALKHRQGKNHKTRIVAFVGSPIQVEEKELVKLAKKLKKEKVNIDIINIGEEEANTKLLNTFIETINGKEGTSSHLVTIPPGPHLTDALVSSPILQGEDGGAAGGSGGGGFEFGVDPNDDPELALALRVSMEEQRARQQAEAGQTNPPQEGEGGAPTPAAGAEADTSEEAMLQRALAMSMDGGAEASSGGGGRSVDLDAMTEEEQIAYAMRMSMAEEESAQAGESMEVDDKEDYSEVMDDPAFLQSVLQNLPGVDPQSEAVKNAMGAIKEEKKDKDKEKKEDK